MATASEIPTQMKAAAIDRFGPPEVIHTEIVPVPKLARHEVLVQVATAGVGAWEPELIDGSLKIGKPHFPAVFGSDGAGTVVAMGAGVKRFALGDRVYGWAFGSPKGGFFAEYAAIAEKDLAKIPDTVPFDEAGALAVGGITALQGFEALDLEAGQPVMILGSSGGVGHIAVQLAKRLGLRVFAVASKADGVRLVSRLGADAVADGHRPDVVHRGRQLAPDGFPGALVFAGGEGWKAELELVAKGGSVAWPNGVEPLPMVRRGVKRTPYDGEDSAKAFERLNELLARGPFHIELSRTYTLDEAARALEDVRHHHIGKLAIKIR
jgi:NADPH2:quinone reductase